MVPDSKLASYPKTAAVRERGRRRRSRFPSDKLVHEVLLHRSCAVVGFRVEQLEQVGLLLVLQIPPQEPSAERREKGEVATGGWLGR